MQKSKKKQIKNPPTEELLNSYDSVTLIGALNTLENSLGWEVFKSFIYYQASVHGTMSNVLVQESGKQAEACAAGAKAEVLREVVDKFMEQLKSKVVGDDGVVTNPIPEAIME